MASTSSAIDFFSSDYFEARQRFVAACEAAGGEHHALELALDDHFEQPLSIDIAVIGSSQATRWVALSSGVHGVEAPLGSALQLAVLENLRAMTLPKDGQSLVLIHAVNPYGFAMRRRFNEQNVDLNRNFLLPDQPYHGAPPLAGKFRKVLGPPTRPLRIATSTLRMGYLAARHGKRSFWETLPVGQYDHPDWIFYGGQRLAQSGELLGASLPKLLPAAEEVIHLDFHTGLGRWANCELLLSESESSDGAAWWHDNFSAFQVVESDQISRYQVRGSFGPWLQSLFPDCRYHYATAEFGTYAALQVVRCLADENRWTQWQENLPATHWSRVRLSEAFAPKRPNWRQKCFDTGSQLVAHAANVLAG
ncbi:M14 family metallopeptidase [Aeoliella sp. ICT_H6.2]|uniref:M14 family metallopeptidase n=1 Tax=Aeoliella straminimaris TaxID=2954799 RepID=A0A9X2FDY0_9BACT|nr:M14 family metallopeptidase [Aeoliella straminimaris]